MPRVNIEAVAFGDGRFKALGRLLGTTEYDALGRMAHVWRHCTDRQTATVRRSMVNALTDRGDLADHIVAAELAEDASNGMIRVRGTGGRIEWLGSLRANAQAASAVAKTRKSKMGPRLDQDGSKAGDLSSLSSLSSDQSNKGSDPNPAHPWDDDFGGGDE